MGLNDGPAEQLPLADAAARQRIEGALDESFIVEAAAGTGKTTQLVRRLVAVLREGRTTVDRIVAVTFTRKAAGELKLRLRQELDRERQRSADEGRRHRLEEAMARLEEARIGTIHSFCGELLRERPVEAGVDPSFAELDEGEARRLWDRAFRSWVERRLDEPSPGLRRALSRLAEGRGWSGETPLERLSQAGWSLVDWRDYPAVWRREPWARQEEIDQLVERVGSLAEKSRQCEDRRDYLRRSLEPVEALSTWIEGSERVGAARDYDALEARLVEVLHGLRRDQRKGVGPFAPGISRPRMLRARELLLGSLEDLQRRADADLAALLQSELRQVVALYEQLKREAGGLDFLDLLLDTRTLLVERPEVRRELQERFTHLFVDELQDTDPLQLEILLLLAADDPAEDDWRRARPKQGKLFLVGDPKQSIYRFRRADVLLYQDVKQQLTEAGVQLVHLSRSFRALRPLQELVNGAFAPEMTGDRESGQPEYVPLAESRGRDRFQPAVVALPVPRPYGNYRRYPSKQAVEEQLPDLIAAWVGWLLEESGWRVEDAERRDEWIPVRARDVCLLFRRFVSWRADTTRSFVRAFEARGIPHLLIGGRSFHQREEVETLRAALTAVEWPDDELAVFATLKGSLFAILDDALLRFREEIGRLHPFRPLPEALPETLRPIGEALGLLAELHRRRNRTPIVATLNRLLVATRAHAGFALRPAGQQVLANVQHVLDLARSFEISGGISFRGFVDRLTVEAETLGTAEAPVVEEGAEGVRLMTVHTAKGLEFPVVILADPTTSLARRDPDRVLDPTAGLYAAPLIGLAPHELLEGGAVEQRRQEAEGVRIAYVAATRARDVLVVPAVGDGPQEGWWVSPLAKALYPPRGAYRKSSPPKGCPDFGEVTVLTRPEELDRQGETSVRPGEHAAEVGGHRVVWWDPAVLELEVEPRFGVQHEELIAETSPEILAAGKDAYDSWCEGRRQALARGSQPSRRVIAVSATEEPPPPPVPKIEVSRCRRLARPAGVRFGTLVHAILRDAPLDADEGELRTVASLHGRQMIATTSEVESAIQAASEAFAHPLLRAAAGAERLHRETPFLLPLDGGVLLEGTFDLAFRDESGWTVVDFKTDHDLAPHLERYGNQIGWYVYALGRLTGEGARGVLLAV